MTAMEIGDFLSENNVRPTHLRVRIYDYLYKNRNHPSVDTIYSALLPDNPFMSRTTVYNTLREFAEKGVVKELTIEEGKCIFDADISEHGHFLCSGCGKVFDFEVREISERGLDGFKINRREVYSSGLCPDCVRKNK